jgi:polysaccharide pyruvyl transferase WcaK-like protein
MRLGIIASIGEGNLGDELILESNLDNLYALFGKSLKIDIYTKDLDDTTHRYGGREYVNVLPYIPSGPRSFIRSVFNGSLFRILIAMKSSNSVIIGGGGIFYSKETEVGVSPLLVWCIRMSFMKLLGVKMHIVGVGVEHLSGVKNLSMMKKICSLASTVCVRDLGSAEKLRSLEVPGLSVSIIDDVVFDLNFERSVNLNPDGTFDKVGICIREWGNDSGFDSFNFWSNFCEKLIERFDCDVDLIPMSYSEPDDRLLMNRLSGGRINVWGGPYKKAELSVALSTLDLMIGVRYHSCISALKVGVPIVSIIYGNKTKCFAEKYALASIKYEDLNVDALMDKCIEASNKRVVEYKKMRLSLIDYYKHILVV